MIMSNKASLKSIICPQIPLQSSSLNCPHIKFQHANLYTRKLVEKHNPIYTSIISEVCKQNSRSGTLSSKQIIGPQLTKMTGLSLPPLRTYATNLQNNCKTNLTKDSWSRPQMAQNKRQKGLVTKNQ